MTQLKKAQRVCLAAAGYIEARGWTRGKAERHGRVCLSEALRLAEPDLRRRFRAARLIRDVISTVGIPVWNDAQKTRRPVLAALRRAGGQ